MPSKLADAFWLSWLSHQPWGRPRGVGWHITLFK
jgi:hypothetical protein